LLVDVGGGDGYELIRFAKMVKSPGRLILQDVAEVIEQVPAEWSELFTAQVHDYMKPQPETCRSARVFYLRLVCHGLYDADCKTMLGNLRDAMKPGYSSLLINEVVLPDTGCSYWAAAFDVSMMVVVNARERTKRNWEVLLESVGGLRVEKIWPLAVTGESVIEVVRTE
jgi:hypothetical protein